MASVHKNSDNNISVNYPVREATQVISNGDYYAVRAMSDNKVRAIKFIRLQHNLGLYEAKQVVDTILAQPELPVHTHN